MARARNIKPAFFTNDHLADVHPLGRLLFIGLWTVADREGRLEDRPRRIKAEVLPYDDVDCDTLLNQLAEHGFILRYSVDSKRFIQVLKFNKHQNPHMKEAASVIPAPDLTGTSTVQVPNLTGSSPAESLNPLTESLNPQAARKRAGDDADFDKWYEAYPKKVGKGAARKAFAKAIKSESLDTLISAVERQRNSEQWAKDGGQFIPNPATWLNQERWDDSLPSSRSPQPGTDGIPAHLYGTDRIEYARNKWREENPEDAQRWIEANPEEAKNRGWA